MAIFYNESKINDWNFDESNIKKVYYGTTNTSRLPSGYTEVEYVESTGNASVNLGIQLCKNANDTFYLSLKHEMTWDSSGEDLQTFLTDLKEVSPYPGWAYRFYESGAIQFNHGMGNKITTARTQVSGSVYNMTINCTGVPSNSKHDYPLNLFSSLDSTQTPWRFCKGKLYNMEVTYNGNLVRNLVPCYRNNDNVAGLYDLVNDVFYTSVVNPLVAGNEVQTDITGNVIYQKIVTGDTPTPPSPSGLPSGYTEVEYVQNQSQAYINTDLQLYSSTTNSFEVETKLTAAKSGSQTYQNVFSCMSESGEPYPGFSYRYVSNTLNFSSLPNGQNTVSIVNNADSTQTVTVTSSSSQRTYTHTYPLTLCCGLDSSRNPFRFTNSKFYYCKIKMNDSLVMDFVPCIRDNDNMVGLYDLVNNVFYYPPNYSSYQLVAGPTKQ